jgi:hypothetical protein
MVRTKMMRPMFDNPFSNRVTMFGQFRLLINNKLDDESIFMVSIKIDWDNILIAVCMADCMEIAKIAIEYPCKQNIYEYIKLEQLVTGAKR